MNLYNRFFLKKTLKRQI